MKKSLILFSLLLSGCSSSNFNLPAITAREMFIKHQNPVFSVSIQADNVVDHGTYITADRVSYDRDGRFTTTIITLKGYRRDKEAEGPSAP